MKVVIIIIVCLLIVTLCLFKYINDIIILNNRESKDLFNFLRENKKRTPKMVFDLAEMYYHGIDEKVTPKGYVQKGIECNEKLALKYYYQLISNKNYKDISIFRIAEIYRNSEKLKNLEKSKKLYLLLLNSEIMDLKMNSFERIQSINTEMNLPLLQDLISFEENFIFNERERPVNVIREPPRFIVDSIRNDSQNIHDSTVVKTMRNKLNSLKEQTKSDTDYYKDMKNLIQNCNKYTNNRFKISKEKIKRALENLDKMYSINIHIDSVDSDERSIINTSYSNYLTMDVKEKNNFVNNLVLQLSDGTDICAQGRVGRVISSIDSSEDIKPLWVIRQDMMNKAPVLRSQLMIKEKLDPEIIDNPKSITEEHISELFEKEFKHNLRKMFEKEYVTPGILTKEALDKELDSWLI